MNDGRLSQTIEPLAEVLDENTVDRDPFRLLRQWFDAAVNSGARMADAMTLATASRDGAPSARVVLLKQMDEDGLVFYTNYNSRKARELDENPRAALVLYWSELDRQVRAEGTVERVSPEESDEYFRIRPRESQLGALASPQSEVIEGREILEKEFRDLEEAYKDREVDRPEHWGGYRLRPTRIEFWLNRSGRLHDRIVYERLGESSWTIARLAP